MRKFLLAFLAVSLLSYQGFAQKADEGTSVISLSTGIAAALGANVTDSTIQVNSRKNGNVIALGYDYHVTDDFTVGGVIANQVINLEVGDTNGLLYETGSVNRLYVGFRGRIHYGNGEKVRFYSGFRVGMVFFSSFNVDRVQPGLSLIEDQNNRSRYSLGITPIGMNVFLTDEFAIHLETNFGAPGILFLGANYRF